MASKRTKYRGSSVKRENLVEMYGFSELLNKIEKAGGKVDEAVKKCVDSSLELVGYDMKLFVMSHHFTGDTQNSFEKIETKIKDGKVSGLVGFNIKKGGLPAIFLDVGTPKQKPYFFRYYAVENNREQIHKIQQETLEEILKELM